MSDKFDKVIQDYIEQAKLQANVETNEQAGGDPAELVQQKAADGQPLSPAEQKLLDQMAKDAKAGAKSQSQTANNARIQTMQHKSNVQQTTGALRRGEA